MSVLRSVSADDQDRLSPETLMGNFNSDFTTKREKDERADISPVEGNPDASQHRPGEDYVSHQATFLLSAGGGGLSALCVELVSPQKVWFWFWFCEDARVPLARLISELRDLEGRQTAFRPHQSGRSGPQSTQSRSSSI